jgi:hypothetical protein
LLESGTDITVMQLLHMLEIILGASSDQLQGLAARHRDSEEEALDILQVIASATDEGA